MRGTRDFALLALCFLLSGLAALVYQTAWTRELAFVFGTSELAVATVLAAYMAGLAAGAAVAGRIAHRIRRPVLAYGLLELGIGLSALAVPLGIRAATALLLAGFGGHPGLPDASQLAISLYYLAAAFAVLMLPTAFMGATLPLLARHAVRSEAELGSRIAALYSINTLGAVVGTLLTAFVLLPRLGLRGTVFSAVGVNALVFVLATGLVQRGAKPVAGEAAAADARPGPRRATWALPAIAVSGFVSFTGEVLWTRLLSHVLGGSVYAFSTMLASFLLGIALGSAFAARRAKTAEGAARWFAAAQLGTGALTLVAFAAVDWLPSLLPPVGSADARLLRSALASIAVLFPAAFCIGATYPLAVRVEARGVADAGSAAARTYAWNTAGAIAGAVFAAYWVLPLLGFDGAVRGAVALNFALAALALAAGEPRRLGRAWPAFAALAALAVLPIGPPWRLLESSPFSPRAGTDHGEPRYFRVGRSATVMLDATSPTEWRLRTNGLPESAISTAAAPGGSGFDLQWMTALPTLVRPGTRRMVVVGLGGGVAVESVPESVEAVHVIELEPDVIEANRAIGAERAVDPLADPRVHLHENDARSALLLSGDRFDAIVAQASHPWTAGASHLYTREFFELVASRLTPSGVFVQWMGPSFVDGELLQVIVATLRDTWPHVRVYRPGGGPFFFVASAEPLADAYRAGPALERASAALARVGIAGDEDLAAALLLDEAGAERFAAGAPVATDDANLLQMRSPFVALGGESVLQRMPPEIAALDPLPAALPRLRADALVRQLVELRELDRAARVMAAIGDPEQRDAAQAAIALGVGRRREASAVIERALARDPGDPEARALRLTLARDFVASGRSAAWLDDAEAGASERAVIDGLRLEGAGDFAALATLDPTLAALPRSDPFQALAEELRIRWRVESGDVARAREAIALVDAALPRRGSGVDLLQLRARAAARAGEDDAALASVAQIVQGRNSGPLSARQARELAELLEQLPPRAGWEAWRAKLAAELDAARTRAAQRG